MFVLDKEMERKVAEAQKQAAGPTKKKKKKKKNAEDVRSFDRKLNDFEMRIFRLENDRILMKKI